MSYRNLRKKQNECRDIDTLKMILEDSLVELKHKEKKLNSVLEDNKVLSKACNKLTKENTKNLKALEFIKGIILNVYNWELVEDNGKYKILEDSGFIELEKEQYDLLKELL